MFARDFQLRVQNFNLPGARCARIFGMRFIVEPVSDHFAHRYHTSAIQQLISIVAATPSSFHSVARCDARPLWRKLLCRKSYFSIAAE